MNDPIKTIEIGGNTARVYETGQTFFENEEGELITTLPFPVDEKTAGMVLVAYECGHDKGYSLGYRKGRKEIIELIHEILGVDKLIDRVGTIAEAHA